MTRTSGFNLAASPSLYVDGKLAGSACGVWTDGLTAYLLTAAHVVGDTAEGTPVVWIDLENGGTGYGWTFEPELNWLAVDGGLLDAALVAVNEAGPFQPGGSYPWPAGIVPWDEAATLESVVICGSGGNTFATLDGQLAAGEMFGNQTPRAHGRLLRFRCDIAPTAAGDSGAPIISLPDGRLVAMHIAERTGHGAEFSLGVPAEDIQDAFSARLLSFALRP